MAKPILLTVDDDLELLQAVRRDLQKHYSADYRVVSADSGMAALDVLRQLDERGETAALLLSDQRMPQMSGVEFLEQAQAIFPDARRVLLTAYSDTEAAIQAINTAKIDYYLTKPYDPPEEAFYPLLTDLLDAWKSGYKAPYEGITILGNRWSPDSYQIKDFLARSQVPYRWLDVEAKETDDVTKKFVDALGPDSSCLPQVQLADGTRLTQPTIPELAEKIGLHTQAELPFYDLVIVGGGPAGLAAAVYGASEGLKTVMVEREAPGGQAGTSSRIENYLGFLNGLSGADLARRAVTQAKRFGVEILAPQEVVSVCVQDQYRHVTLGDGTTLSCHAMLIATGVSYRKLDAPGVDALSGAGVYYGAAMTEALSCKDDDVYIIGGANSAGQAAIHFAKYARCVTLLVRAESLTKSMSQYLINEIEATENIRVRTFTDVVEAHGDAQLEAITVKDVRTGATEKLTARSLFIFIGAMPRTDWLDGTVARDPRGFILAGPSLKMSDQCPVPWPLEREPFLLESSIPGVFVAGDVRAGSVKRVASGVGEGAIAVQFIHQYLSKVG